MDLRVSLEERVRLDFRHGRVVRVTPNMFQALSRLRPFLVGVARRGNATTYAEASAATDGAYLPRGMGPMLDVLTVDCMRRGEPSLAPLVVSKSAGEVGLPTGPTQPVDVVAATSTGLVTDSCRRRLTRTD